MTDPEMGSIEAMYEYLTSDGTDATQKNRYFQERSLDLVPRLVDQICVPSTLNPSPHLQDQGAHVLHLFLDNASPKELSLTLETELERAIDEIAECFLMDEDDADDGEDQEDEEQDSSPHSHRRKTLQSVSKRICVALDSHIRVLDRLTFKTSKAGILVIQGFLQRLDDYLVDLTQAINEGESLPPSGSGDLCTAVAAWCFVGQCIAKIPGDATFADGTSHAGKGLLGAVPEDSLVKVAAESVINHRQRKAADGM
ncbi:hypothetical protein QFC21_002040 [Naganishia friedmannii]|uniref:Uncharacterized protein n=1 Tax=Naganishia friedmannii TaxID=89922 RepID=A0ACC2VYI1_9TREE|nr:hypothetical protein QFC21_002040 [Naganishia friedmannii]